MADDVAAETPDPDRGPEIDAELCEADADDLVAAGADARLWYEQFRAFVTERSPVSHAEAGHEIVRDGSPRVREAEDLAVVAAYRALEAMARRFDPPPDLPPFLLNTDRFGRDG